MTDNTLPLFGYPFFKSICNLDGSELTLVKQLEFENVPIGGYISKNKTILNLPKFKSFKKSILLCATKYFRDTLRISNNIELEITTSWAVIHKEGDSCDKHYHENSLYSGVVYLQTTPESGQIIFETPRPYDVIRLESIEYNIFNGREFSFTPQNNDIYIFPSILPHKVTKNNSMINRYSVAFNFFVKGTMGLGTQYLNLDLKKI